MSIERSYGNPCPEYFTIINSFYPLKDNFRLHLGREKINEIKKRRGNFERRK
jgi:hypothetical protein